MSYFCTHLPLPISQLDICCGGGSMHNYCGLLVLGEENGPCFIIKKNKTKQNLIDIATV